MTHARVIFASRARQRAAMGRKGVGSRRKQTLQLSDAKKQEKARLSDSLKLNQSLEASIAASSQNQAQESLEAEQDSESGAVSMDYQIADFLKEISALGSTESTDEGNSPPEVGSGEAEGKPVEPASNPSVQFQDTAKSQARETERQEVSGGGGGDNGSSGDGGGSEPAITFWRQVVDEKSNHTYYWNRETNTVSWTLPAGGVLSNVEGTSDEEGSYAKYYEYYAQTYYGVATQKEGGTASDTIVVPSASATGGDGQTSTGLSTDKVAVSSETSGKTEPNPSTTADEDLGSNKANGDEISKSPEPSSDVYIGPTPRPPPSVATDDEGAVTMPTKKVPTAPQGQSSEVKTPAKKPRVQEKAKKTKQHESPSNSKQAELAVRLQVSSLADQLTRKLQFLHVSTDALSDLQTLSIQLETRLADWKEGGLSSKFMLSRLVAASKNITVYEKSAAPDGWKCMWDSTSCRYVFHNLSSGETQFEYPLQSVLSPGSCDPRSSELSSQEEDATDPEETAAEDMQADGPLADSGEGGEGGEEVEMDFADAGAKVSDSETPRLVVQPTPAATIGPQMPTDHPASKTVPTPLSAARKPKPAPNVLPPPPPPLPPPPSQPNPTTTTLQTATSPGPVLTPIPPPPGPPVVAMTTTSPLTLNSSVVTATTPQAVEEKPLTVKDVRQKFQKARQRKRSPVSYETDEIPPGSGSEDDSEGVGQEGAGSRELGVPIVHPIVSPLLKSKTTATTTTTPVTVAVETKKEEDGEKEEMEFISEFPITQKATAVMPPVAETTLTPFSRSLVSPSTDTASRMLLSRSSLEADEARLRSKLLRNLQAKSGSPSPISGGQGSTGKSDGDAETETVEVTTGEPLKKKPISFKVRALDDEPSTTVSRQTPAATSSSTRVDPETGEKKAVSAPNQKKFDAPIPETRMIPEIGSSSLLATDKGQPYSPFSSGPNTPQQIEILTASTPPQQTEQDQKEGATAMEEIDSTTPASKDTDAKSFATETLPPSEDVKYADKLSDIQSSEEEGEIASAGEDNSTAPVGRRCYMDLEVKGESSEVKPMEAAESDKSEDSEDRGRHDNSSSRRSSHRSSKKHHHRSHSRGSRKRSRRHRDYDDDNSDRSDFSADEEQEDRYGKQKHSKRSHRDDDSDHSDDYHHRHHHRNRSSHYHPRSSSRRHHGDDYHSDHSEDEHRRDERSSRRSEKDDRKSSSSRRSHRHRSRTRSREPDYEKDSKSSSGGSSKKKKKEKKEKKRKRTSSEKSVPFATTKEGSEEDDAKKTPSNPNVKVGKVGKMSSVRTLGQEKKPEEEAPTTPQSTETPQQQQQPYNPSVYGQYNQQQISASYYQQPSTGQVPYYPMGAGTVSYPNYQASVYPYQQQGTPQQVWSAERQQWVPSNSQTWSSPTTTAAQTSTSTTGSQYSAYSTTQIPSLSSPSSEQATAAKVEEAVSNVAEQPMVDAGASSVADELDESNKPPPVGTTSETHDESIGEATVDTTPATASASTTDAPEGESNEYEKEEREKEGEKEDGNEKTEERKIDEIEGESFVGQTVEMEEEEQIAECEMEIDSSPEPSFELDTAGPTARDSTATQVTTPAGPTLANTGTHGFANTMQNVTAPNGETSVEHNLPPPRSGELYQKAEATLLAEVEVNTEQSPLQAKPATARTQLSATPQGSQPDQQTVTPTAIEVCTVEVCSEEEGPETASKVAATYAIIKTADATAVSSIIPSSVVSGSSSELVVQAQAATAAAAVAAGVEVSGFQIMEVSELVPDEMPPPPPLPVMESESETAAPPPPPGMEPVPPSDMESESKEEEENKSAEVPTQQNAPTEIENETSQADASQTEPSEAPPTSKPQDPTPEGDTTPPLPNTATSGYYNQQQQLTATIPTTYLPSSSSSSTTPTGAYNYSYAQSGYDYAQAYTAYMQQAAAYGAYGAAMTGQYYPGAGAAYYGAAYGNPYATGYYAAATTGGAGGGGMYSSPAYQSMSQQQQQAAYVSAAGAAGANVTTVTTEDLSKKGKGKGDFALAGNKEKNVKSMMQKWNTFQDAPK